MMKKTLLITFFSLIRMFMLFDRTGQLDV
ncbi:hypothetical protein TFKS16_1825 [Tannerella forsythia KS16]|nr:hypothetical protein TF3313_1875 [Tannerella forsythia 3313]BAR52051.1 hypothetical protein TFKS16_1825 [Tannerella forsythia KS16]